MRPRRRWLALAVAAAPGGPLEVLEADHVDYDVLTERGFASGGVVLRRGLVTIRAAQASYDTRTGEVDASGGALLLEPGRAVAADRLHIVLDGPYQARRVIAFLKPGTLDLSKCRTLAEARATGQNRVTLGGAELRGEANDPTFELDEARFTFCDCGADPPSWELRAPHASVTPGKRAWLTFPVLWVTPRVPFVDGTVDLPVLRRILNQPVPVLPFPALYLPLGDRQTGLLMPELTWGGVAGFGVAQPLFVTLGRSWDTTLSGTYVFGPTPRTHGPGLDYELRWAPVEGARGHLNLSLLHASLAGWPGSIAEAPGGNRYGLSGSHQQRFSDATYLSASLGLVGDPLYVGDFTGDARLPDLGLEGARRLSFFPGSTIGNFDPPEAVALLRRMAHEAGPGGALLIGVDVPKDASTLERAYDDAEGVTAAFDLNLLARMNRELGSDFRLSGFRHRSVWNRRLSRVEMHLESKVDQVAHMGGVPLLFRAGETIHTESAYKWESRAFDALAALAGWQPAQVWSDERAWFTVRLYTRG
jgi:hypothetical protein